jgi:peptidyl-prolyl cis-trans isomerase A (cyclophilin A)
MQQLKKSKALVEVATRIVCCLALFWISGCGNSTVGRQRDIQTGNTGTSGGTDTESSNDTALKTTQSKLKSLPPEHLVTDRVEIRTSKGNITVGLYGNEAPHTVANFLEYVDKGFYSGKVFHRVIPGFMIQGGGFDTELNRAPTNAPISLEIVPGLQHEAGIISMARTTDPHSATSQFFICVANAPQLNGAYAAFGKVEQGMDVAEAIESVPTKTVDTGSAPMANVPITPVVIESISRL